MKTRPKHISVCICTFKRPDYLKRLLEAIEHQLSEQLFTFSVVVVDNDADQSAKCTIEACKNASRLTIDYYVEPEQNIALARNKAVENSKGDFIAFIDDDEFPSDAWLLNLFLACERFRADGVLGPVKPHFESHPPEWIIKGKLFERPTHETGHILEWRNTRTGNALLRKKLFQEDRKWFDPSFGSGGEDRDFFKRKIEEGYVFVWCNEAPVYETVPPKRWKRTILLKRALLRGKVALNNPGSRTISILISVVAVAVYTCCLPLSFLLGQHIFMKYLIKNFDHLGKILAFLGIDCVKEKYVES